jgi:hypothetical protein
MEYSFRLLTLGRFPAILFTNRIAIVGCPRATEGLIGMQAGEIPAQSRLL